VLWVKLQRMRVVSLSVRAMNLSRYQASGILNRPAQSNTLGGSQAWSSLDHNSFSKIETLPGYFSTRRLSPLEDLRQSTTP